MRDYLGNITHKVNTSNTVTAEYSYDAWGRRRDKDDWSYTLNSEPDLTADRGFTGHEHLAYFNIVNMNGRLYDPLVGRFMSPDNSVQSPDFSQNFNRFSYCYNNPLAFNDPDGEFVIAAFLIGMAVSAVIDYGIQVGMNYTNGYKGKDAWVNKVDFFDVTVSGVIGGLTAGWGASLKAGDAVGKVGMFMVNNAKLVKTGEIIATSAVDITGEGWQDVTFNQFGQRAVTGIATMYASDYVSNKLKKSKNPITEQNVGSNNSDAITITPAGVALPKGAYIPEEFVENPYGRKGSYGIFENGKFIEKLRIDPGTLPGFKGPNSSHFHLDGGKKHIFDLDKWKWWKND